MTGSWAKLFLAFSLSAMCAAQSARAVDLPARDLLRHGRPVEAANSLEQQLSHSPDQAELHFLLCRSYYAQGKWDPAIQHGERAIALAPSNSEYHLWLGRAYGQKAERSSWFTALSLARKLRSQFEKAVELDGSNLSARSDLAEFYIEAPSIIGGGTDKALAQAAQVASQDASLAHWINARVAEKRSDAVHAENEYKEAITSSGGRPDQWLNLASFYRKQNRYAEMELAIHKAVSAEKHPSETLTDAAGLLLRTGRSLDDAARFVRQYIATPDKSETEPEFRAHYLLGEILEKQGDKNGAATQYQQALALLKDFPEAQQALARVRR